LIFGQILDILRKYEIFKIFIFPDHISRIGSFAKSENPDTTGG
jgi:hypothetical protein